MKVAGPPTRGNKRTIKFPGTDVFDAPEQIYLQIGIELIGRFGSTR